MDLKAIFQQARDFFMNLSLARRLALVGSVLGVIGLVLAVSAISSHETYAYLFTDLSTEDAAAVAAKLKELKVPYRVEAGGTAIEVPEERVHELRLDLAGAGLPRGGGVGFEIFDKARLGSTDFEQRVNLRRALEGELSRTISTIGSVQAARVHLVLPEHSVFVANKEEATASIVVKLRSGRNFDKAEVASVVHLVAAAVPGLSEDRVSVVSADGLTLHRPRSGAGGGVAGGGLGHGSDSEEHVEREVGAYLEEHARTLIERVVGPGHVDVRVNVALDSSTRERTEEHYDPAKIVLRSEQKNDERTALDGLSVAGVPGAGSNLPPPVAAAADGGTTPPAPEPQPGVGSRLSYTRNWEVDRVAEKTTLPAGTIARLSVAVLLDGKPVGGGVSARDKAELDQLAALAREAVGFNAKRGDSLQIDSVPFAALPGAEAAGAATAAVAAKRPTWQYIALAGGVVALLGIVFALRRRAARQAELLVLPVADPLALTVGDEAMAAALLTEAKETAASVRGRALDIASQDPATAAMILREWLNAPSTALPVPAQF